MARLDCDEGAATGRASFSFSDEFGFDDGAVVLRFDHARDER
jgi:hypothetical protein